MAASFGAIIMAAFIGVGIQSIVGAGIAVYLLHNYNK
jgi:hypothetical protein